LIRGPTLIGDFENQLPVPAFDGSSFGRTGGQP
jgi:hypothetical protein